MCSGRGSLPARARYMDVHCLKQTRGLRACPDPAVLLNINCLFARGFSKEASNREFVGL
jgi:hypothetical protein